MLPSLVIQIMVTAGAFGFKTNLATHIYSALLHKVQHLLVVFIQVLLMEVTSDRLDYTA